MGLVVQKYGGSSLETPEHLKSVARRISHLHLVEKLQVIVVVSAMGKTTDRLTDLAYSVSATPSRRELDMLLSTGERVSMALLTMALHDQGCPAISFTGSQAGLFTCNSHSNARIKDIRPIRVESELQRGVVVLAGFQGVDPITKEITTLGRGGSDTTAVAMAAHFKAPRCEILKDVSGVLSGDPKFVDQPYLRPELTFDALLEMTYWGSKVLHFRSVELAKAMNVPLLIAPAHESAPGTRIVMESPMYEESQVLAVHSHALVQKIKFKGEKNMALAFQSLRNALKKDRIPWPQILATTEEYGQIYFYLTAPKETIGSIHNLIEQTTELESDPTTLSSITLTCKGCVGSDLPVQIVETLNQREIPVHLFLPSPLSATVFLSQSKRESAMAVLHERFIQR